MHADSDGIIPGNALAVDPKKQFRPLAKFGNAFLNRFQCSNTNSEVLKGTVYPRDTFWDALFTKLEKRTLDYKNATLKLYVLLLGDHS